MTTRLSKLISTVALPVCLAAMDACWIYAVAWVFGVIVLSSIKLFAVPAPPLLAGLELAAWGLSVYLLDRTRLSVGVVRGLVGFVGIAASVWLSLLLNPETDITSLALWLNLAGYGVVVSLALWAIGGYRGSERTGFDMAYGSFRLGLIAVVSAALLASLVGQNSGGHVWEGVSGVALWFFAWSLCALALGNREVLRQETGNADIRFWGPLLAGSLGCIFIIATISGSFTLGNLLGVLQQIVSGALLLLGFVFYAILYAIFWLIAHLPRLPIKRTQGVTPTPTPQPQPSVSDEWLRRLREIQSSPSQSMSPELQTLLTALVIVAFVVFAAWLISRSLRRTRQNEVRDAMEERESLGSWSLLYSQMRMWLDLMLARFRRGVPGEVSAQEDDLADLQGRPEWSGTLSVRQIYARLQSLAAQLGYPRAPRQTPVEYLSVLSEAMPDLRNDLTSITTAYIEARYGPLPASGPVVLAANSAWKRAEPVLKSVKREA